MRGVSRRLVYIRPRPRNGKMAELGLARQSDRRCPNPWTPLPTRGRDPLKAVVCKRYGPPDVLGIQDVPTPAPRPDQIQIRVFATTVTAADHRIRAADY